MFENVSKTHKLQRILEMLKEKRRNFIIFEITHAAALIAGVVANIVFRGLLLKFLWNKFGTRLFPGVTITLKDASVMYVGLYVVFGRISKDDIDRLNKIRQMGQTSFDKPG